MYRNQSFIVNWIDESFNEHPDDSDTEKAEKKVKAAMDHWLTIMF